MGLNMNYSLTMEGYDTSYKMPDYTNRYFKLTEEFVMQTIADFNQEIRESQEILKNIYDAECINEATAAVNIVNGIKEVLRKVKEAISKAWEAIKKFFADLIKKITDLLKKKKDKVEENCTLHERQRLLSKALATATTDDKVITITNIEPTVELLDKSFPNMELINDPRLISDMNNLMVTSRNTISKTNNANKPEELGDELASSNSLNDAIQNDKETLLSKVFGKYEFDETNITSSAIAVAEKIYGKNDKVKTEITVDLYGQAIDNIDKLEALKKELEDTEKAYNKCFNEAKRSMEAIDKNIDNLQNTVNKNYESVRERYYTYTREIIKNLSNSLNVIRNVLQANQIFIARKITRRDLIIQDSYKVKKHCHWLISKYTGTEDAEKVNENNHIEEASVDEFYDIQDEFNAFVVMMNEAYNEQQYTKLIYSVIQEAEGDQPATNNTAPAGGDNAQQPAATETTPDATKQNIVKKAGSAIMEWLKNIIGKLGETFQRFKQRIDEVVVKADSKWWADHKEQAAKIQFTDTTISDWHCYNTDLFAIDTYIPFDDPNNDIFASDEAFQNEMLKKINNGTTPDANMFADGDSFSQKINKIYAGRYIEKDKPEKVGQGGNFDGTKVNKFLDDFVGAGFGGATLSSINDTYKKIDEDFKKVQRDYTNLSTQVKANNQEQAPTAQNPEPVKNESANMNSDFESFNLAETFGLMVQHEVEINPGPTDAGTVSSVEKSGDNKELDARIKRCFNCNTIAVTAKMTACLAAYKQYIGLYKAIFKGGKKIAPINNEAPKAEEKPAENNK